MLVFDKTSSIAHNCAWRNSDAGLTTVANGSWVQREHCIAIYIDRNCLFRRRLGFNQFLAIVEDLFYDLVNEVVRQVLVRDREVVEPNCMIVSGQRTICSGRNQGLRDFGHLGCTKSTGCLASSSASAGIGNPPAMTTPSSLPSAICEAICSIAPKRVSAAMPRILKTQGHRCPRCLPVDQLRFAIRRNRRAT